MDDISKGTVTILLIIAVVLTAVMTWRIVNSEQTIMVQQSAASGSPTAGGKVSVGVGVTAEQEGARTMTKSASLNIGILKAN